MIAILMAGGRGSRMGATEEEEKPMVSVRGRPMISYVLRALRDSGCFERIITVVSGSTQKTAAWLARQGEGGVIVSNSSGANYVRDLNGMLALLKPEKVFVAPSDLPLLQGDTVRKITESFGLGEKKKPCLAVVVSKNLVESMRVASPEYCFDDGNGRIVCYTGISVLDSSRISGYDRIEEQLLIMDEPELALNVNTVHELRLAESLLKESEEEDG